MSSYKISQLICSVCERVCVNPVEAIECSERGLPRFPAVKRSNHYRLPPAVFDKLFPERPANDNEFSVSKKLVGNNLNRMPNCIVRFDPDKKKHRYKILLYWLGDVGNWKADRNAWAWFDELEKIDGGEN
jgi:hypothetical protein